MGDEDVPLYVPVLQNDSTLSLECIRSKMISFGLCHDFDFGVIPLYFLVREVPQHSSHGMPTHDLNHRVICGTMQKKNIVHQDKALSILNCQSRTSHACSWPRSKPSSRASA